MAVLTVGALSCFPLVMQAAADDDERVAPVKDAVVIKECGACHMVFQPGFLPARSWQKMMEGLKDHFGENAELDEATTKRITEYLTVNAAHRGHFTGSAMRGLSASETPLRISELPWFVRKHESMAAFRRQRCSAPTPNRRATAPPATLTPPKAITKTIYAARPNRPEYRSCAGAVEPKGAAVLQACPLPCTAKTVL